MYSVVLQIEIGGFGPGKQFVFFSFAIGAILYTNSASKSNHGNHTHRNLVSYTYCGKPYLRLNYSHVCVYKIF